MKQEENAKKILKEQKEVLEIKNMLAVGKNSVECWKIKLKNLPVSKANRNRWKVGIKR